VLDMDTNTVLDMDTNTVLVVVSTLPPCHPVIPVDGVMQYIHHAVELWQSSKDWHRDHHHDRRCDERCTATVLCALIKQSQSTLPPPPPPVPPGPTGHLSDIHAGQGGGGSTGAGTCPDPQDSPNSLPVYLDSPNQSGA
jgi:hypothetical protein